MSESNKRLVGVKRLSLAGMAEGWGDECYVLYLPASYDQMTEIDELDPTSLSKKEQVQVQLDLVRRQFVAGKVKQYEPATGEYVMVDMTADDAVGSIPIADAIYAAIVGFDLDPKAIRQEAMMSALPTTDAVPTATTSSEDSATVLTGEATEK